MAIITEVSDSSISAYATGSYTIGFDDEFQGTIGSGDFSDGINLPTMQGGTTYTVTLTVEDVNSISNLIVINPNNFHSFGYSLSSGTVTNPGEQLHYTGFVTINDLRITGNTIEFDFTPTSTQYFSFQISENGSPSQNYSVSIAETPIAPLITDGIDDITGTSGADAYDMLKGDDIVNAGAGDDTVNGMNGDDSIIGGDGFDMLNGNAGNDTLHGAGDSDTIHGSGGDDSLTGGTGDDYLNGGNDNDTVFGDSGSDTMLGGSGDDFMWGGDGGDTLDGGTGNDSLNGGAGSDTFVIRENSGADKIRFFDFGLDVIDVSGIGIYDMSQMTLTDDGANVTIDFGNGSSVRLEQNWSPKTVADITASTFIFADNPFASSAANDTIRGNDDANVLSGGDGDDRLFGFGGDDIMNGDAGKDDLRGGEGNDTLNGGDGNDKLQGQNGDDELNGGARNDNLQGGAGNDTLNGGSHNDRLDGGADDDVLNGEAGHDKLIGNTGNDTLSGGTGRDQLTGGHGADVFVFETNTNRDTVTDFDNGTDMIDLTGLAAAGITQFSDLTITDNGAHATIALDGGNSVTLNNTLATDLDASDFIF